MTLLIVAGDPSGDLHGAGLIRALKDLDPGLRVAAVGGPRMREEADEFLEDLSSRGVTGFWEPAASLRLLLGLLSRLKAFLARSRPDAVVCVDYYGFNRRVLGLAKAAGVPAFYFISPQVWASRPGRVGVLKRLVRRLFVIFPFEEELYRRAGVPCAFVGHPLLDLLPPAPPPRPLAEPFTVGLLPGSRPAELRRHLPLFLSAFRILRRARPATRGLLFAAPGLSDEACAGALAEGLEVVRESGYARRAGLDLAVTSSGTATLENALLGVPMVVVYKLSWPTYAVARALIRVPHIAMANLLAGKALVPELIQHRATPAAVAEAAESLLADPDRHAALRRELLGLRELLGGGGAAARAASGILAELGCEAGRP